MKKLLILLAVLLMLTCTAAAYEIPTDFTDRTLEDVVTEFREAYGMTEQNFSLCYYNTVTGEEYAFNDTWFSIAASTYKLPLNMYFYEMQQSGEITGDTKITWTGQTLDYIHEQSIVNSNNELSEALMYYWGDHVSYKQNMRKYFTMTDEEIDYVYYVDNYYCTRMMMDALSYLYEYRADFEEMIGYMKQAQPNQYFKAGVTEYEVAHKYGWFEGAVNDVGIIYAPQPFLLAVYTQDVSESVVAQTAALFTAYNVWQNPPKTEEPEVTEMEVQYVPVEEPEEAPAQTPEQAVVPETVPEEEPVAEVPAAEEPKAAFEWWMVAVALIVFVMGGGVVTVLANPARLKEKYKKKYPDLPDDEDEESDF